MHVFLVPVHMHKPPHMCYTNTHVLYRYAWVCTQKGTCVRACTHVYVHSMCAYENSVLHMSARKVGTATQAGPWLSLLQEFPLHVALSGAQTGCHGVAVEDLFSSISLSHSLAQRLLPMRALESWGHPCSRKKGVHLLPLLLPLLEGAFIFCTKEGAAAPRSTPQ